MLDHTHTDNVLGVRVKRVLQTHSSLPLHRVHRAFASHLSVAAHLYMWETNHRAILHCTLNTSLNYDQTPNSLVVRYLLF
jgi:hypothetical protein